jgi:hypothetical protein
MPLFFRDRAHFIRKRQRLPEIWKRKRARDVMAVRYLPLRDLLRQILKFLPGQRRNSALARHACFARKIAHDFTLRYQTRLPFYRNQPTAGCGPEENAVNRAVVSLGLVLLFSCARLMA